MYFVTCISDTWWSIILELYRPCLLVPVVRSLPRTRSYPNPHYTAHVAVLGPYNTHPRTSIKTSSDSDSHSESHSDQLRFSRKSPHRCSFSLWLRCSNPFFATFKTLASRSFQSFLGGDRGTPLDFHKTRVYVQFFMLIAMVKSDFRHIQKWRLYSAFQKKLKV